MPDLILFNKPYNVLSQFTDSDAATARKARATLAEFIQEKNVYPAGRLDLDSEGLLLLTSEGKLQSKISDPRHKMPKTYWVQVEGEITPKALEQLRIGVELKDGKTRPARVRAMDEPDVWNRIPPIRERKSIPVSWLELTIKEGRNRQVRRMTAAVGFPTLRLIRTVIGPWSLGDLAPGEYRKIHSVEL